ncbi:hypothetical protein SAMN04515618_108136 [Collimonas sp. OK307]|nr:hypothetical protein SAMN04515618_108136 [Collimonas sp. OK307]
MKYGIIGFASDESYFSTGTELRVDSDQTTADVEGRGKKNRTDIDALICYLVAR